MNLDIVERREHEISNEEDRHSRVVLAPLFNKHHEEIKRYARETAEAGCVSITAMRLNDDVNRVREPGKLKLVYMPLFHLYLSTYFVFKVRFLFSASSSFVTSRFDALTLYILYVVS